jgi:cullin 1
MASAYQLAILAQFNENDTQIYQDILAGTRLSDETLKPQMSLLVKARVLLQEGNTYDLNLSAYLPNPWLTDVTNFP